MIKTIIIEGFGLPGAGKSTCMAILKKHPQLPESIKVYLRKEGDTKFLEDAFQHHNKKINSLLGLYGILFYLILRPIFFLEIIKYIILYRFNKNFLSVLRRLLEALICYSKLDKMKKNNKHMMLDEGLLQYLGALVVNTDSTSQVPEGIVQHVVCNYLNGMIYFNVDFDMALSRIKKRNDGRSRFDNMDYEQAIINLRNIEKVFIECLETAKRIKVPVLELNKENSIETNIELVLGFLSNINITDKRSAPTL